MVLTAISPVPDSFYAYAIPCGYLLRSARNEFTRRFVLTSRDMLYPSDARYPFLGEDVPC